MDSRPSHRLYSCADAAMVRAAQHAVVPLPPWPDLHGEEPEQVAQWAGWLRETWAIEDVRDAVGHANPALARHVDTICASAHPTVRATRRTALAVMRYALRMTCRATPFGLFAGVAPASFSTEPVARWGGEHRVVARADASWLAVVIATLESCLALLTRLPVITSNTVFVRGHRLVVPYPSQASDARDTPPAEVSMTHTAAVRIALAAAHSPITASDIAEKLAAEFPSAPRSTIDSLLGTLVERRVLITSLHAPSTTTDAFAHLLGQLDAVGAQDLAPVAALVRQLRDIAHGLRDLNRATVPADTRRLRITAQERMAAAATTVRSPLAIDLRVDCSVVLPPAVAREAEAAASVLTRLTVSPFGTAAWRSYHNRFFARYGVGSLVPMLDVVNPDIGLGFPAGYLGGDSADREPLTARDQRLLELVEAAVLDGHDEILLTPQLVADLAVGDHTRAEIPPHAELRFQLGAQSLSSMRRGDFDLTVLSVSRGIGTTTGRFLTLLDEVDRARADAVFERLPASDSDTLPVQLSFAPLNPADAHVARTPQQLSAVISVAEHREPSATVIELDDLVVGCDSRRLYLASLSRRCRVEPTVLHALDLRSHTPPLARFLAEVGRAHTAVLTGFDWGAAATLPFLPRLRAGRTIVSAARWRLDRDDLPGRDASLPRWQDAFSAWCARRRVPPVVQFAEGDQVLRLDLAERAHLSVLRAGVDSAGHAVLTDAPARDSLGWFGGRAHEVVTALTAAHPATGSALPPTAASRVIGRDHGLLPGSSATLMVKVYGHADRVDEVLTEHLPLLWSRWDVPPRWWYLRYRDPDPHLRLRITLTSAHDFATAAGWISDWAGQLRRDGLLRDIQLATSHPETGRWGSGPVMDAAEDVFAADSQALLLQLGQHPRLPTPVLAAANFVAIACAFTGSTDAGMRWLITHATTTPSAPLDREHLALAVRASDPAADWTALRAAPGGQVIAEAWAPRDRALSAYRRALRDAEDIDPDRVLDSLVHAHFLRGVGIDRGHEGTCLHLARATALAWTRTGRGDTTC